MYFWRYEPIKTKLREQSLSQREILPYLIVFALLAVITEYIGEEFQDNIYGWIDVAFTFFVTIGGTIYLYKQNGGNDGFWFLEKYIVLGWIVFIRLLVYMIPAIGIAVFAEERFGWSEDLCSLCFVIIISIVYYYILGKHIKDTR